MEPLNLKDLFARKYKVLYDEAAKYSRLLKKDPCYFLIPCRYGDIYPYSDKELAYHCIGKKIRNSLHKRHPEIEITNMSDDGHAIFIFDFDLFDTVSKYAIPLRNRTLSDEHRKALTRAGREALKSHRNSILNSDNKPEI